MCLRLDAYAEEHLKVHLACREADYTLPSSLELRVNPGMLDLSRENKGMQREYTRVCGAAKLHFLGDEKIC